jgi:hypothetical protein
MKVITLSVHNGGNGNYRFYVNSIDSRQIFMKRKQKVKINIEGQEFHTHTTCGPKDWNNLKVGSKKGYDLYSSDISNWIINKRFYKKVMGKCRTFDFIWKRKGEFIILTEN